MISEERRHFARRPHGGQKLTDWKDSLPAAPHPLPERAMADGVSGVYEAMRDRGELVQIGGRVVPVGDFMQEAVIRFGKPQAIAADRWRAGELEDGVKAVGLNLPEPNMERAGVARWCR